MTEAAIKAKFHFLTEEQYEGLLEEVLEAAENSEIWADSQNAAIRFLLREGFDERFLRNNMTLIDELIDAHTDGWWE